MVEGGEVRSKVGDGEGGLRSERGVIKGNKDKKSAV